MTDIDLRNLAEIERYRVQLAQAVQSLDLEAVEAAAQYVFGCWRDRGTVWIVGNGGSMATASHAACDLAKWTEVTDFATGIHHAVDARALDSLPLLTAWSNDLGYSHAMRRILQPHLQKRDVLIAISCSGASDNVIEAVSLAQHREMGIVALTGDYQASELASRADLVIHVDARDIRIVEDCHLAICHMIAGRVKDLIADHLENEVPF